MRSIQKNRIKLYEFFSIIIVVCSELWMASVTPLSPFYMCIFPIMFYPFYCKYKIPSKNYTSRYTYFVCAIFAIYLSFQPAIVDSTIKDDFVLAFSMLFYFFVDTVLYSLSSQEEYKKLIKLFCGVAVLYMIADFIKRYTNADFENVPLWMEMSPIYRFYLLKGIGLNHDANNSAAISLTALCMLYYYRKVLAKKNEFPIIFFSIFILTILTCSRAAILAFIVNVLFYYFFYKQNIYIKILDVFGVLLIVIALVYFLMVDPSGKTKIDIFQKTWEYFWTESDPVKFLFGYGGGNTSIIFGRYAHNPISIFLVGHGFLGLLLYLLFIFSLALDVGYQSLFILIPYFLFALSFSPLQITYVLSTLSLVKHSKRIYGL